MLSLFTVGLFLGTVAAPASVTPLEKAKVCYESLDYVCADQQLSIALRSVQNTPEVLAARELDLLLAFAWRDERRMETAIQKLFELDSRYSLQNFPPDVRTRLERYRPEPPKPDALGLELGYRLHLLSPDSSDAAQWLPGEGFQLRAGKVFGETFMVDGYAEWVRHYWRGDFGYTDAQFLEVGLVARQQIRISSLRVLMGAGAGINRQQVHVADSYASLSPDSSLKRWGGAVNLTLGACLPIWSTVRGCAHFDPKVLIRVEKGQARTSYIFPIGLGLRYEYLVGTTSE